MSKDTPREISRFEILSFELEHYIEPYYPWDRGDTVNESYSQVHRDYTISGVLGWGAYHIGKGEAKAIFEAHERKEYLFSIPFEDIAKEATEREENRYMTEVAKDLFYVWTVAKAIASFFKNGRHLNYLDIYQSNPCYRIVD
jgi:hypothetical protein